MAIEKDHPRLWRKLITVALRAGRAVVHQATCLYYASQSPATPAWAKGVILGALAYFVLPVDFLPDVLPGVGFADDWFGLAVAAAVVAAHVTTEHKAKAYQLLSRIAPFWQASSSQPGVPQLT